MDKNCMPSLEQLNITDVQYQSQKIDAPHLSGLRLNVAAWLIETPLIGSWIISGLLRSNKYTKMLSETVIPDAPMFIPEFPQQEIEPSVKCIDEVSPPATRVSLALDCLPQFTVIPRMQERLDLPFQYWRIRDYAHAYRTGLTTPSVVAERLISAVGESQKQFPSMSLFISFDAKDIQQQADASSRRFDEGNPISILDGIFMAVKDEVDCLPHITRGGTTWMHKVRDVKRDAVCVARLRECGVIFIGKANQHELGSGTTGNNPHYGTARNPHDPNRYTGGSSSGPAALVSSGLCPAALGTDGGGSIRIPAALCGVVGFKTTHGRTSCKGVLELAWTVEVVSPIAGTVEDAMLVYAAMLGSCPDDITASRPMPPCFPMLRDSLSDADNARVIGSLRLGKYTEWFNDVSSLEVSEMCMTALQLLIDTYGIQLTEIVLPELEEMRIGHVVSIGSEIANAINPYYMKGRKDICYEIRSTLALFRAFSSSDYLAAQRLRRRIMHHHLEAFKSVDVIVTPTTAMTAPKIPKEALRVGESNLELAGNLMRFVVAPNFLGLPAITVPVGHDKDGLPIGLQLIGQPWFEATLLRLAFVIELAVHATWLPPVMDS
eukprot:c26841_g1_i2 orf=298-2112(+)